MTDSFPRVPGPSRRTEAAPSAAATRVPSGIVVIGDLAAEEDLHVEGEVTGTIDMPGHALTIGEHARVDAKIFARDVTVRGRLSGRVTATEVVDVRIGAAVSGDVAAPAVILADGAVVQGRVETKRVDAAVHVARYRMKGNASA